jgi:hypothetical protein
MSGSLVVVGGIVTMTPNEQVLPNAGYSVVRQPILKLINDLKVECKN